MRYRDDALHQHPHIDQRNVFYMGTIGRREEINTVLFPSEAQANDYAQQWAQQNPTEAIIVLEQKSVFELPELPQPVRKRFTTSGELIPDA
jgi:hypothetical protein